MLQIYLFTASSPRPQDAAAEASQAANRFIAAHALDVREFRVTQTSSGVDNSWNDFAVSVVAAVDNPDHMRACYRRAVGVENDEK